jgi:anti-sigma regulatory factor (Ser/Thr protein kinase)
VPSAHAAARDAAPVHPDGRHGLRHSAALVSARQEFLDVAVGFLDEGLRAADLTVLALPPERAEEITGTLGERAGAVETDTRLCLLGVRAPDGLAAARRLAERAAATGSGRLRILAEPQFGGGTSATREGERYEAATNAVLAGAPVTALCVYDRAVFPAAALRSVVATHPFLLADGEQRANPRFQDPRGFLRRLPIPREPVESGVPVFAIDAAPVLPALRHAVKAVFDECVPDEEQRADLYLAVSEVAANAFRHGGRPVSARIWADSRRIVCTVTDGGSRFDDPLAGFVPAHGDDLALGGMGLWLARKLWDSVDLVLGRQGFTVRLATDLR